jgi:ABC-type transport system involved in cytochrome c biogenesis permease subunit
LFFFAKQGLTKKAGLMLIVIGQLVITFFIFKLWLLLDRPPMRTLGETRLWYSFFLPLIGLITYQRWKYNWFLAYSLILSGLFLLLNVVYPENYSKTLMPALQSPWFIPHVIVYIFAYALLAASSIVAAKGLLSHYDIKKNTTEDSLVLADNLVYIGFAFLTMGLLFGALWAKEAWGHYWTWDPKETWAFITWIIYLLYIHFRYRQAENTSKSYWILTFAFLVLLICWFGVNYLPSAANSIHTYTR